MATPFRLILFDFFNTLVVVDPTALPRLEVAGRQVITTAGLLTTHLQGLGRDVKVEQVLRLLKEVSKKVATRRDANHREVPGVERFRMLAEALLADGSLSPPLEENLARELLEVHMEAVMASYRLPESHRECLGRLRKDYALAILSNFDHAPALRQILAREGIGDWFAPVVISHEIGFRKPLRQAFELALEQAGHPPAETLFVGDSLEADVAGARQLGMPVAWIKQEGQTPHPDCQPDFTLDRLPELETLLRSVAS